MAGFGPFLGPAIPESRLGVRPDDLEGMIEQPLVDLGAKRGIGRPADRSRPEGRREPREHCGVRVLASGQVIELGTVDVDQGNVTGRTNRAQGLVVGLAGVGGENDDLPDLCFVLPRRNKFVQHAVEGLPGEAGAARVIGVGGGVDPERDDGGPNRASAGREIVGQAIDDQGADAQR